MSEQTPDQNLHLPSLVIKNFRGIDELTIPRLGRVTLLAGKNGVGKTTVLDAVRVWSSRANRNVLEDVLLTKGDVRIRTGSPGGELVEPSWGRVFTNRRITESVSISASPPSHDNKVQLRAFLPVQEDLSRLAETPSGDSLIEMVVAKDDGLGEIAWSSMAANNPDLHPAACNALGPDCPSDGAIEHYWNEVALSSGEDVAVEAMNLVADVVVERVAVIDPGAGTEPNYQRRLMAKIAGQQHPIPLRSLGDGAVRTFAVALALANSADGFLLIDEAENGIHHSVQAKFWNMVLQTAERNNVQVIATTHSWDCVVGFAKAANELAEAEGMLYRIQRNGDRLRAVEYPEETLLAAAKHGIEVR